MECTITANKFDNKKVLLLLSAYSETDKWTVSGSECPGVGYSLELLESPPGGDLSIFKVSEPSGKVRVTASPTLSTRAGIYKVRVTA
jgi:hypothetical protein